MPAIFLRPTSSQTSRSDPPPPPVADRGVTPRVVLFSLLLACVLGYVIPVIDYKYMNTFLGATHLPPGAIGTVLVLVLLINPLLGLLSGTLKFSRNETLTIYITCLFSSLVPGHGAENFAIPNLLAPVYFATRENKWLDFLEPYTRPLISPAFNADGTVNEAVVQGWYLGGPVPWSAWIGPLLFWIGFTLVTYAMLACLGAMLRRQWAEREALAFPLLKLPLAMTEDMEKSDGEPRFWRNPTMWMGVAIVVFIQALRGLNVYFPTVPTFPLELELNSYFSEAPWNQLGWAPLRTFPIAVGIAYLLTSEVSFSLWFFYWFLKFGLVAFYYLGYPAATLPKAAAAAPSGTFLGYQSVGCYFAFAALLIWTGREHFLFVARRAFGREKPLPEEKQEVMSYPVAFWGFVLALAGSVALTVVAGARLDLALAMWLVYLVYALGLTRVAVEGGMLALLNDSAPLGLIGRLLGTSPGGWLSPQNGVVGAAYVQGTYAVHMRGFSLPSYVHAFKLAHDRQIAARPLLALIAGVVLVSTVMGFVMAVKLGYDNGGLSLTHKWWATLGSKHTANFVETMSTTTDNAVWWHWGALSFGATLTYAMMAMRARFAWFPFHPIGYLMAPTYPANMFWFSFFLGWLAKSLITRFGGSSAYRRTIPLFLGLALGDVAMMLLWLGVDAWQGRMNHALMPQ